MLAKTHFSESHLLAGSYANDENFRETYSIRKIREMLTFPSGLNKKAKNHHENLNKMVI